MAENVAITNTFDSKGYCESHNGWANTLAWLSIILFLIGLILLFKWIYENYDKWKLPKKLEL
jgi:hypothetical protein